MVWTSDCFGMLSGEVGHGVLQGESVQGEWEGGPRHGGEHDCQVGEAGAVVGEDSGGGGRRRQGGRRGDERCEERGRGEERGWIGEQVGIGEREEETRGAVHGGGDAGGAACAAAEPQGGAAGEAGARAEARHGESHLSPRQLRGGEPAVPPDLGPRVSALRIAHLPPESRARLAGESHAAPQDDDAEPRGLNRTRSIEEEFAHHKPRLARLNNGSFGSCPQSVLDAQKAWSRWWLRQPDECYFGPLAKALHRAREAVADTIHAPVEEVFLLENLTAAASMVAMDVMWAFAEGRYRKGDSILTLNFTYGAVKKAFQAYASRVGGRVFQVTIPFPVSSQEQIVQVFETALRKEREQNSSSTIRLAVFDHIVSMPTMILPIRKLVKLCRSYGVESIFIDGAHGIGNLDFDVGEIDADYYTSNLHKWMFAPSTASFFHCKAKHLARLHHPIISHLYGDGIVAECTWVGTRDYSALVAVPEAIQFVKDVSGSIENYGKENHRKVVEMAKMLATAWDTFLGTPPEMCAAMAMIALPPSLSVHSQAELLRLRRRIRGEYGVDVHLYFAAGNKSSQSECGEGAFGIKSATYVRISHAIYNKTNEYVRLRDAINDLVLKSLSVRY